MCTIFASSWNERNDFCNVLQKELRKKEQRLDALQVELKSALSAKGSADSQVAELTNVVEGLKQQLSVLSAKDGELQTLAADLAETASAKAALEAKVRVTCLKETSTRWRASAAAAAPNEQQSDS
jgi:chromosome segregation ATPase